MRRESRACGHFFDLFALGDGEELIVDIMETTARAKEDGVDRDQLVRRLAAIPGMYCPALGNAAVRRVVTDLDAAEYPEKFIVPFLDTVHDRVVLEVMRGCCRGCRFCQAGMIYRPVRERSLPVLCEQAERLVASTGYEEMGLLSLSTADYTGIQELARKLVQEYGPQGWRCRCRRCVWTPSASPWPERWKARGRAGLV